MLQQSVKVFRDMGSPSGEATILYNMAYTYGELAQIENAIHAAEEGKSILVRYGLTQNGAGATIAQYEDLLARLYEKLKQE